MTSEPSKQEAIEELGAATRAYYEAALKFASDPRARDWLREMLREGSVSALTFVATRSSDLKLDVLRELVEFVRSARDVDSVWACEIIQGLPKDEMRPRLAAMMDEIIAPIDDFQDAYQLIYLLEGLEARTELEKLQAYAAAHEDAEMREVAEYIGDVLAHPD